MAVSRYDKFSKVRKNPKDPYRLETFPAIQNEDLNSIPHNVVMWKESDRMDAMAEDMLGDSRYWWVICMMNDLVNPFSYTLIPGTLLKIPHDVSSVINIVNRNLGAK